MRVFFYENGFHIFFIQLNPLITQVSILSIDVNHFAFWVIFIVFCLFSIPLKLINRPSIVVSPNPLFFEIYVYVHISLPSFKCLLHIPLPQSMKRSQPRSHCLYYFMTGDAHTVCTSTNKCKCNYNY